MQHQIYLHILDQQVLIHVDSATLAEWLNRLYDRFRTSSFSPTLEVAVQTDRNGVITSQSNTAIRLALFDLPVEQQADIVSKVVYSHVESHLLFHGGAVTRSSIDDTGRSSNQGVMLVGHSGRGKTTLTLELVRRGWGFLSDEVAALALTDGSLAPFARAIHLRPHSLPLLGLAPNHGDSDVWTDIDQLHPHRLSGPTPTRFLFLLENDRPTPAAILLTLDRRQPALAAALGQIAGVGGITTDHSERRLRLSGDGLDTAEVYYQIERICRSHACRILDLSLDRSTAPDFAPTPAVTALATADATVAILPYLISGRRSRIWYGPWQGNPLALFRTLAQRLSHVHCFRLRPGPLNATADLIERTLGESP